MKKPHIVLLIPRGEAVRNFLYSDTIDILHKHARVTLLSVVTTADVVSHFEQYVDDIIPLKSYSERWIVNIFREIAHEAHFRWLDSAVSRNARAIKNADAKTTKSKLKRLWLNSVSRVLGQRPIVEWLTTIERWLTWHLRPTDDFITLFQALKPDLVFNGSHIHGQAGSLPTRTAHHLGIPTAGFIFSWDNLTSRSRIFEPYDHYLVWHQNMEAQLLSLYREIKPEQVHVTGTPQFDYHFKPEFMLSREEVCRRLGADPTRPYIIYTTGVDKHFPEEHHHIAFVADYLATHYPDIQLVVRTYAKGVGEGTKQLQAENRPNMVFPTIKWDTVWFTPDHDDLATYTSTLAHALMGINPASTVSLELMMFDKPVLNIGFDPPNTALPLHLQWARHITFDHYLPVAQSGAVSVATTIDEMAQFTGEGIERPEKQRGARQAYLTSVYEGVLDGRSAERVARTLLGIIDN